MKLILTLILVLIILIVIKLFFYNKTENFNTYGDSYEKSIRRKIKKDLAAGKKGYDALGKKIK